MQEDEAKSEEEVVLDRIITAPNIITFIRLLLLPVFLFLLLCTNYQVPALVIYAIAASTDCIDGQVARRTKQVSKLGKLLDPIADRLFIAVGVIAIYILGRLPIWIPIYLIVRDVILLLGGKYLLYRLGKVPPVVYVGKFATAFLMVGFCLLLLGFPYVAGLNIANSPAWLPGFGVQNALMGIWFTYAGVICSIVAFAIYIVRGILLLKEESPKA